MEGAVLAALILFTLTIFPFLLYPLTLRWLPQPRHRVPMARPLPPQPLMSPPRMSMCVCAYNEEAVIADKARNMLALQDATPGLELLVYVDGRGDRTAEILAGFTDRITVVVGEVRRGKSHGMNQLVARARGDILIFSDANVMVDVDAPRALAARFTDPETGPSVGCVCGHLIYTNGSASPTAGVNSAYWRLEEAIKRGESALGSVMGADGSLFAIRRDMHRPVPPDIIDDFYLSLSILCDGWRVVSAPDARAWENTATASGDELRRKIRIACQSANVHRLLRPRLKNLSPVQRYMYVAHKGLRWLSGLTLTAATLAALLALGLWAGAGALAWAAAAGFMAALLAWGGVKPFAQVFGIAGAMLATSTGVVLSLFGARFATWRPAASVRGPVTVVPPAPRPGPAARGDIRTG
ncbi:MAG: hypothetical protein RLY86_624 [Pseudomonadota bacterium]|jgi:cellulose synthase/poly-beta-1,6-N-acetylglucosamine synthase-like glycosyltransferase